LGWRCAGIPTNQHRREILRAIWSNTNADGDAYCNANGYAYAHSYANCDSHSHAYTLSYANRNS
jgi:hypothetical protein